MKKPPPLNLSADSEDEQTFFSELFYKGGYNHAKIYKIH